MADPATNSGRPPPPPDINQDFLPLPSFQRHPPTNTRPCKSFVDAVADSRNSPTIPVRPTTLHRGEPAVLFTVEDVHTMAIPFKLALVGKFSNGRPSMEVIRKFFLSLGLRGEAHVSLMDDRHVLIKLQFEEDYTRIWYRQTWYINGRAMRVFKWSTTFRCSEESPIVPVWVSLPFLPVHLMYCRHALFSIASAIGKPLRVDQATASLNRPSVARVLIEYDISQPLLPRLWIGEGEDGFWQDIIFENVPHYCGACKHLGHTPDTCYITRPELRTSKPKHIGTSQSRRELGKTVASKGQPTGATRTKYVVTADHRGQASTDIVTGPSTAHDQTTVPEIGEPSHIPGTESQDGKTEAKEATTQVQGNGQTTQTEGVETPIAGDRVSIDAPIEVPSAHLELTVTDNLQVQLNTESLDIPEQDNSIRCARVSHSADDIDSGDDTGDEKSSIPDSEYSGSEAHSAEPFVDSGRLEATRIRLGMDFAVSSLSGKIWVFWSSPFTVEVMQDAGQVLHCRVCHSSIPATFYVSFVYASCSVSLRVNLWEALASFAESLDSPWMVGGDFNVVQAHSEVLGGNPQSQASIDAFNLALMECGLEDVGFTGSPFTWTNGRTRRRLDRVVANPQWASHFSVFRVSHLNRTASDHSPLLISLEQSTTRGPSRFRFLHTWLRHQGFIDVIRQSWSVPVHGSGMFGFQQKLTRLKLRLKAWNREIFGNVFQRVREAEAEVTERERIYDLSGSTQDRVAFSESRARLQHALSCEEAFLRQMSSVRNVRTLTLY
ncbi:Ribonuclease H domain [Melia azedarach]|uniref:Ribonuclease H domain n=1 Tax=Melia azedarach TaxID=155640 RepID=A0ACC1YTK8_MELAZ|nr:Ribonuclease H domain [Melia azedarach]